MARINGGDMTSLTPYLTPTRHAINEYALYAFGYENKATTITLGDDCDRRQWLKTQGAKQHQATAQDYIFFDMMDGHKKRMIDYLDAIGCDVCDTKKKLIFANGKAISIIDGLIQGVKEAPNKPHLLMICPQKEKAYKKGMTTKQHIKMQTDMRLLGIDRTLFIRMDMNSGEFELSREKLDIKFADAQVMKAERIVNARTAPERIGTGKPSWYECKMCKMRSACFSDKNAQ